MKPITALLYLPLLVTAKPLSKRATLIPNIVFNDQSSLESYFSYNYPWGDTHNGAARMVQANSVASSGVLTLTSHYTGASDYAYNSGTVFAKQHFSVPAGGGLDFTASFIAPVAKGTWPAFWLNSDSGWPPEIDVAEWKGDGKISFNTFNTSNQVEAHDVYYPNPAGWHTVKAELRDAGNGLDVKTTFYIDGSVVTSQTAKGYIGKGLYLIIDYQMEGSSGSPGPTTGELSGGNASKLD